MKKTYISFLLAVVLPTSPAAAQVACGDGHVMLQVLGSGGGTFARFHEAGAQIGDLDLLALSHLHPDHSSEVPALLWVQEANMSFSGPTGNAVTRTDLTPPSPGLRQGWTCWSFTLRSPRPMGGFTPGPAS